MRKKGNFASRFEPNGALFRGNDPEFILVTKNVFQHYIICLYLKSFAKNHVFFETIYKLAVKTLSRFACRVKYDSKSGFKTTLDSFRRHNPMAILKLANELPLKIIFFEVNTIVSIYVKIQ